LHHAFKTSRCFELVSCLISILRVDELWYDTLGSLKVSYIFSKLENKSIRIAWEVRVALAVCYISVFIPFSLEQ